MIGSAVLFAILGQMSLVTSSLLKHRRRAAIKHPLLLSHTVISVLLGKYRTKALLRTGMADIKHTHHAHTYHTCTLTQTSDTGKNTQNKSHTSNKQRSGILTTTKYSQREDRKSGEFTFVLTLGQTNPRGGSSIFIHQLMTAARVSATFIIDAHVSATVAQVLWGQTMAH